MDLSIFYKELKNEVLAGVIAVCLMAAGVIYLGICVFRAKATMVWVKILSVVTLLMVLFFVVHLCITFVIPMKKDLDQKAVIYYEGKIEIVEVCYTGWKPTGDLIVRMDGKEYHLTYARDDQFFTAFEEGDYIGEIVYLRNTKDVLFFKATPVVE